MMVSVMSILEILLRQLPLNTRRWVVTVLEEDPSLRSQMEKRLIAKFIAVRLKDSAALRQIKNQECAEARAFLDRLKKEETAEAPTI